MQRKLADATATDRVPFVDRRFGERVSSLEARTKRAPNEPLHAGSRLTGTLALDLFRAQIESRHIDLAARALKQRGAGYYTIGSAGHEGNAAVAAALRPTDPAFLHYRSGAFFLERARQAGVASAARDMLLGMVASSEEPIAGGRHKVFGSLPLWIPPQTSTIASHLPKAVGMAFMHARMQRLGLRSSLPDDAVVVCSFGDASVNHSTACGAFNAASWAVQHGLPLSLLFVCEDNGIGISVPTPASWVSESFRARPGLAYFEGDGLDLTDAYEAACEAASYVRRERRPAFLHLRVVRLLGHAGSDAETMYRSVDEIAATEEHDPLIGTARLLAGTGTATPEELVAMYEDARSRIAALAEEVMQRPKLTSALEVMAPLAPRDDRVIADEVAKPWDMEARARFWRNKLPESERPMPLGAIINRALG
ncbi:MAG TPA: thiamine pyrophosphate-dependent enzyme, partial [Polyangiaceae bacterium]|nr:thiamine pyrophosphate-dependent enzyme [Polyangiaceae bacterium]